MNPETIAALDKLFDKKIEKLETAIADKVTTAVVTSVSEAFAKNIDEKIESMVVPLTQRQDQYEQRQDQYESRTNKTLISLQKQFTDLSDFVKNQNRSSGSQAVSEYPPLPLPPTSLPPQSRTNTTMPRSSRDQPNATIASSDDARKATIVNIIDKAKCVIGLAPITPEHVEQQGDENLEAGLVNAVIEYLRKELNVKESEINEHDIETVFLPVKSTKDNFEKVYVRFTSHSPASLCLNLAKGLKNRDNKVSRYFPKAFSARLSAMSSVAYQLRNEDPPCRTNIEYTEDDITLMVCPQGQYKYKPYVVQNLPPVDLSHMRSPPVGRKTKRQRSSSTSPPKDTKKDRKDSPPKDSHVNKNPDLMKSDADIGAGQPTQPNEDVIEQVQDKQPDHDHVPSPTPVPQPFQPDIGQISTMEVMSPTTGHLNFDFSHCPARRMSLNY